jgi:hypothetical protein
VNASGPTTALAADAVLRQRDRLLAEAADA